MDGLFNLAKMLFGINIDAADGLAPVMLKFYSFVVIDGYQYGTRFVI